MMNKNKKIINIIFEKKKGLKKLLKEEELNYNKLYKKKKKTSRDIDMMAGHNYTIGYCTATLSFAKEFISLLKLSEQEIDAFIKENKKISKQNKKHIKDIVDEILK